MVLRVIREPSIQATTHGSLYIDGHWQCWTLEDQIRTEKIAHETCIPAGSYTVQLSPSKRFQRVLPEILDVPWFSGIRIHPGNVIADTSGCLLVGRTRADVMVGESKLACDALLARLRATTDPITITIENPA